MKTNTLKFENMDIETKEKETKPLKKQSKTTKEIKEKEVKNLIKKPEKKEKEKEKETKEEISSYFEATGRRKTSIARVRLYTKGEKEIIVNNKPYDVYFPTIEMKKIIESPLEKMKCLDKFRITINVKGGGIHSQSEAVMHGISRALVEFNPDFRKKLRKAGCLTRDPRQRERKKFGLKRARRSRQWRKR